MKPTPYSTLGSAHPILSFSSLKYDASESVKMGWNSLKDTYATFHRISLIFQTFFRDTFSLKIILHTVIFRDNIFYKTV